MRILGLVQCLMEHVHTRVVAHGERDETHVEEARGLELRSTKTDNLTDNGTELLHRQAQLAILDVAPTVIEIARNRCDRLPFIEQQLLIRAFVCIAYRPYFQ